MLDQGKERQSFLKKSLATKDLKTANVRAKPVQAGFDRVFGEAEQLLAARPLRGSLSATEIKRLAELHYAIMLETDETTRREGTGSEPGFQSIAAQLNAAGVSFKTPFAVGVPLSAGLWFREVYKRAGTGSGPKNAKPSLAWHPKLCCLKGHLQLAGGSSAQPMPAILRALA